MHCRIIHHHEKFNDDETRLRCLWVEADCCCVEKKRIRSSRWSIAFFPFCQPTQDSISTSLVNADAHVDTEIIPLCSDIIPLSTATIPTPTSNDPTPTSNDPAPISDDPITKQRKSDIEIERLIIASLIEFSLKPIPVRHVVSVEKDNEEHVDADDSIKKDNQERVGGDDSIKKDKTIQRERRSWTSTISTLISQRGSRESLRSNATSSEVCLRGSFPTSMRTGVDEITGNTKREKRCEIKITNSTISIGKSKKLFLHHCSVRASSEPAVLELIALKQSSGVFDYLRGKGLQVFIRMEDVEVAEDWQTELTQLINHARIHHLTEKFHKLVKNPMNEIQLLQ